jgi:hypothetical protein
MPHHLDTANYDALTTIPQFDPESARIFKAYQLAGKITSWQRFHYLVPKVSFKDLLALHENGKWSSSIAIFKDTEFINISDPYSVACAYLRDVVGFDNELYEAVHTDKGPYFGYLIHELKRSHKQLRRAIQRSLLLWTERFRYHLTHKTSSKPPMLQADLFQNFVEDFDSIFLNYTSSGLHDILEKLFNSAEKYEPQQLAESLVLMFVRWHQYVSTLE